MKTMSFLFFLLLSLAFCRKEDNEGDFYISNSEWGLIRIPLIEPSYAGSTQRLRGPWIIFNSYNLYGSNEIKYVDVIDTVIVAYDFLSYVVKHENRDTTWHIIIPSIEYAFRTTDEDVFKDSLLIYTENQPCFREPSDLWLEFKEMGYLSWFPDEYKPRKNPFYSKFNPKHINLQ